MVYTFNEYNNQERHIDYMQLKQAIILFQATKNMPVSGSFIQCKRNPSNSENSKSGSIMGFSTLVTGQTVKAIFPDNCSKSYKDYIPDRFLNLRKSLV